MDGIAETGPSHRSRRPASRIAIWMLQMKVSQGTSQLMCAMISILIEQR